MTVTQYPKPNMTNLPRELGRMIFEEIRQSPKADREKMHEISMQLEEKMLEERKKEKANAAE